MKTATSTLFAGVILSATLTAQFTPQQVEGPVTYAGVYDLTTRTIRAADPAPTEGGAVTAVVYNNTSFNGSFF